MLVIASEPIEPKALTPAQTCTFERTEVWIGRPPWADFHLDGDRISRRAIRVLVIDGRLLLEDQSENGSFINGVHGWGTRPIYEGDDIRIGPYRVTVRIPT